jgi:tight adherence protein C
VSAPILVAISVLLGAAAIWELAGSRAEELGASARALLSTLSGGRVRSVGAAALRLRLPERIERSGLAGRVPVAAVLGSKVAGAALGALTAAVTLPAVPGRLAIIVAPALPAAGFLAPDALLERAARRRQARIVAALPEALDLLAVGTGAGRSPAVVLGEIARAAFGPLAAELGITVAEIECGIPQRDAIASLRGRNASGLGSGAGLGALASALERSRRFGSPLADQLHEQAMGLRRDARRRIDERAARAAPKIQLVVALVLVPSVLLMILAALLANADSFFGAL